MKGQKSQFGQDVCVLDTVFFTLLSLSKIILWLLFFVVVFSAPVIPQTGLPGGGGAGKKAAKVPGFVDSTINSE